MGQRNDHLQSQKQASLAGIRGVLEKNFHVKGMRTVRRQLPR
jgi:hypothetical protein